MVNMFVSYCQKDSVYADNIDLYFKGKNVVIHRDIRDISNWKSIREYMHTIRDMDYAILVITDNYLKSFNCMYEVLEVIKEKNYESRIFPVVVETSIYSSEGKIKYVKHWEEKFYELKNQISQIDIVNAGNLIDDLKRTQNICSSIGEFLSKVSDMNNPNVQDINMAIENKLNEQGLLGNEKISATNGTISTSRDIFSSLNIPRVNSNNELTDLQKNKFMSNSFKSINSLLKELFNNVENENNSIQIESEEIDARTVIYEFYKNGNKVRVLKLVLGNTLGSKAKNISLCSEKNYIPPNTSFNAIIDSKLQDGELALYFSIGGIMNNQECKSIEEIVAEIWKSYIQPYLSI
ncbi:toll/interleukin-1 receptor domain-containing protein [Clostridium baratii]|uniref:toll/interleukin-1 receptor domain-containing protein n=1 Tax=Clostridium baratii TaxID=1561 RepID=UPI0005F2E576|nr:toll/interleukin-1 receptor domain-containing protein [Clostridium baratii]KJU71828.1 hypothetical protein UC77_07610 [Clostridium baratii]